MPLQPTDLDSCLALDQLSLGGLWTPNQWRRELAETERPGVGIRHQGELVAAACGWLVLEDLHITLVAVHPSWRRRGLGRRCLEALLEAGGRAGARHATLEVEARNLAARELYRCLGFHEAGVRRGYYRDGGDALIQWCRLGH